MNQSDYCDPLRIYGRQRKPVMLPMLETYNERLLKSLIDDIKRVRENPKEKYIEHFFLE